MLPELPKVGYNAESGHLAHELSQVGLAVTLLDILRWAKDIHSNLEEIENTLYDLKLNRDAQIEVEEKLNKVVSRITGWEGIVNKLSENAVSANGEISLIKLMEINKTRTEVGDIGFVQMLPLPIEEKIVGPETVENTDMPLHPKTERNGNRNNRKRTYCSMECRNIGMITKILPVPKLCLCRCGKYSKTGKDYCSGHFPHDYMSTPETRKRLSIQTSELYLQGKMDIMNSRYIRGHFYSNKNSKNIFYRSSWELLAFRALEMDSSVFKYEYEKIRIPYIDSNGQDRNTIPDILATYKNGNISLIEVKPKGIIKKNKKVQSKINAMKQYANTNNFNFIIWDKNTIDNKIMQHLMRYDE